MAKSPGRWKVVILAFAAVLVVSLLIIWIAAEDTVTFSNNGVTNILKTRASTVRALFAELKIEWRPEDHFDPGLDTKITEGMQIKYVKAEPFTLKIDGQKFSLWVVPGPAKEALQQLGIKLNRDDRILPSPDTLIRRNSTIQVIRMAKEIKSFKEIIPIEVIRREDHTLDAGQVRVVQKGEEGLADTTYRYIYEDGKFKKRVLLSRRIEKPAKPKIINFGMTSPGARMELASRGIKRWRVKEMLATAYYWGPECCGTEADGYTAIGLKATHGIVAVDPKVIPLRTRLYVEGYGFAIAGDVGGAIKKNRIDLCFDTYREALMYGCRKVKVYILE